MKRFPRLALMFALAAGPARAQAPALELHGVVEVAMTNGRDAQLENMFNKGNTSFDPYNLRLFVSSRVAVGFEAVTQVTFSEIGGVAAEGAYMRWSPTPGRDFHLQAGKIPWAVGTWAPRTYADRNPLIGSPMMYQYHTTLRMEAIPPSPDALLAAAGTGQFGPDYGSGKGWKGMPIVYDHCWDVGVVALGSARPFEYSFGVSQGTTAAPNAGNDWNDGKSVLGRVAVAPRPEVRVGVSAAHGAYLPHWLAAGLPAGRGIEDYAQTVVMADVDLMYRQVELRAEGYRNLWQTPTVGTLEVHGGYVEARVGIVPGLHAAGRYEQMRFGRLAGTTIAARPWDNDRDRLEAGLSYRVARSVTAKAVYQLNTERIPGAPDRDRGLGALQVVATF